MDLVTVAAFDLNPEARPAKTSSKPKASRRFSPGNAIPTCST